MIAPEYFNNHIAIEGEIIVNSVPNDTGSVLVWNSVTRKISIRTHAEIVSDLHLMTTDTVQEVTGTKYFITQGGNNYTNNALQVRSYDGSNPGITFYKQGTNTATIQYTKGNFDFTNTDISDYSYVTAKGFKKDGSSDNFFLTGGGNDYDSRRKEDSWYHSVRNFPQGTLIETDIDYSATSGDQFLLEMKGNMYGGGNPLIANIQGYIYADTLYSTSGYSTLYYWNYIIALNLNGKLCFWFQSLSYWQGFDVKVTVGYGGLEQGRNRVTSVSDNPDPGGIKRVQIRLKHLLTKEDLISGNTFWEKKDIGGYWALDSDKPIAGLNGSGSQIILSGGLLASSDYTDSAYIPGEGIFSRGLIQTTEGFQNKWYKSNQRNRIWSFGDSDTDGLSYFQGAGLNDVMGEGIGFHFGNASDYKTYIHRSGGIYTRGAVTVMSPDSVGSQNIGTIGTDYKLILGNGNDAWGTKPNYGTAFWIEGNGQGYIQQQRFDGQERAYRLNLQPYGGELYYGNSEVATQNWVNANYALNSQLGSYVTTNTAQTIDSTKTIGFQNTIYSGWDRTSMTNPEMGPFSLLNLALQGAYPLYGDEEFRYGTNSVSVYNNQGNGNITMTREVASDLPNKSGVQLRFNYNGNGATPGLGGFLLGFNARANAIFVQKFMAKLPVGYSFNNAENYMGDNASVNWLTSRAGTGKWETYVRAVICGTGTSFGNGGHVYVGGLDTAMEFCLAFAEIYEVNSSVFSRIKETFYAKNETIHFNGAISDLITVGDSYTQKRLLSTSWDGINGDQILLRVPGNKNNEAYLRYSQNGTLNGNIGLVGSDNLTGNQIFNPQGNILYLGNPSLPNIVLQSATNFQFNYAGAGSIYTLNVNGVYLDRNINFNLDNSGVNFYEGGKIYKKSGGGVYINRGTNGLDPRIENADGSQSWMIFHEGNFNPASQADLDNYYHINKGGISNQSELVSNGLQNISIGNSGSNFDGELANKTMEGTFASFNGYSKTSKDLGFSLFAPTSKEQGVYYKTWYGGNQTPWKRLAEHSDLSGYVKSFENAYAVGFSSGLSTAAPYIYHATDGYVFLATQNWVTSKFVNIDGQQDITGLKVIKGRARNTGTGWGNTNTPTDYSFLIETESGSDSNNQYSASIGFFSNNGAQAGIHVRSNDYDGTSMAFATTNSFAGGPLIAMTIDNQGIVNYTRSRPTFQGKVIWDSGNLTPSMIDSWNYMSSYGVIVNQQFTHNTGNGLMIVDNSSSGESGIYNENDKFYLAVLKDKHYKYSSRANGWEGINFNRGSHKIGIGIEADYENKVFVDGTVKALGNFKSENEDPQSLFIPDGSIAQLKYEVINEDKEIRLDPKEYYVNSNGALVVNDKNRLIHIIGEEIKMVVDFKEIYPKQQIVIYNFDPKGYSMAVLIQGQTRYNIEPGCFLRLYVTKSLRVIAEKQLPCEYIW